MRDADCLTESVGQRGGLLQRTRCSPFQHLLRRVSPLQNETWETQWGSRRWWMVKQRYITPPEIPCLHSRVIKYLGDPPSLPMLERLFQYLSLWFSLIYFPPLQIDWGVASPNGWTEVPSPRGQTYLINFLKKTFLRVRRMFVDTWIWWRGEVCNFHQAIQADSKIGIDLWEKK